MLVSETVHFNLTRPSLYSSLFCWEYGVAYESFAVSHQYNILSRPKSVRHLYGALKRVALENSWQGANDSGHLPKVRWVG